MRNRRRGGAVPILRLLRRRITSIRLGLRRFWGSEAKGGAGQRALLALFAGCLLVTLALAGCWLAARPGAERARAMPRTGGLLPAAALTPSPFLPAANTRTPLASPTAARAAPWWLGLDLASEAAPLRVEFAALSSQAMSGPALAGQRLIVEIRPGWPCEFDDHRACLSRHRDGQVLLVTVHSGVGGEAQALRDALEGTGLNRAGYSLERIAANLSGLVDSPVSLGQAAARVDGLRVLAALRVPPGRLETYYNQPFSEALAEAAAEHPALQQALAAGDPLLALETCGWRHPAEPWYPGVTDTSGAVYLIVIGT